MAGIVYVLCAVSSFICAFLLFRGYSESRLRLLFWSGIAFTGFTLNNILLFLDEKVVHNYDLSVIRTVPGAIGMVILVYGLIKEEI